MLGSVKKEAIYVIDDDGAIGSILTMILSSEGFQVERFLSGKEAIRQLDKIIPDAVLLDYMLPGEDTETIVGSIRQNVGYALPIILMSAHREAGEKARKLALSDFLSKPFAREDVLNALHKVLV